MKVKQLLIALTLAGSAEVAEAQIVERPKEFKNIDLNLLLRSSLEVPSGENQAGFRLNEARLEVMGSVTPDLDFRVRYRLNRTSAQRTHDNAPGSLDHASVNYKFGNERKWSIMVGKQSAAVGSWEFDNNPTYEYQYSEFVNNQANIFLMAAKLGYKLNDNHAVFLQVHNTFNESFNQQLAATGYDPNGEEGAKLPLGAYASWQGKMFDDKFQTYWSYNISQFAKGDINHAVALGNKLVLPRFQAYLDLQTATLGLDYPNIASPSINNYLQSTTTPNSPRVFAKDVNYKSAILRLDYEFVPKWFITAKGFYETASQTGDNSVAGKNFRQNIGYLGGLEFKPVTSQNFRIFGYYYNNIHMFKNQIAEANARTENNLFAFGFLYYVNTFR